MTRTALFLALIACGPKTVPPVAGLAPPPLTPAQQVAAQVNALVPASHREILRFEVKQSGREFGAFEAIVPAAWPHDSATSTYAPHPDHLPPHNNQLGYSSVRVHTTCAGTCAAKDWERLIEQKVRALIERGYTIEEDTQTSPGQRVVISKHPDKRIYSYYFFEPQGHRYFVCEAEVDGLLSSAANAFQAACAGLIIHDYR